MERRERIATYLEDYKSRLINLLNLIDPGSLEQVLTRIIETFRSGNTLYIAGNGGSAATASHMHADFAFFVRYFTDFRPKVRALTDNVALITAVGNDTSFDDIFVEQMKGNFLPGDAIICISASGNSKNVVKAAEYANAHGGTSIAFVGFDGGKLKDVASLSLFTPNAKGDYGPIEDIHMILDHLMVNYITQDKEFLELSK